jgi:penicillin amidase
MMKAKARAPWRWIAAGLAGLAAAAAAQAEISSAASVERREIEGLGAPARILVDQWGVAHIYADSVRDAFFVQGYNAARDRLWQIDLWRKRGLGLLAAGFGSAYAEQDAAARLFLYRGDMRAEWAAYGPDAEARTTAFVDGINAYVRGVRAGQAPLPVEFSLTDTMPDVWRPEDVVRIRSNALTRNAPSEVVRAQLACAGMLDADALRRPLEPAWSLQQPAGLDPCAVPMEVLRLYELATRPVGFFPGGELTRADGGGDSAARLAALDARATVEGSNNWAIAPSRTATGRPILANDPHRTLEAPSLRYLVHLNAPNFSIIGGGEPALPGISIGHNGAIAFGLTVFSIDQEDLYVYELNPRNRAQYRYNGRWEAMRRVRERIAVRGEPPRDVDLFFTRHGPVLHTDAARSSAVAIRTVWSEPGASAYFGAMRALEARDWRGFEAAMRHWGTPSENMAFASVAGDIGWTAVGHAPIRPNWDGLMPAPGDGRYEWAGFQPGQNLPRAYNPPEGFWASANEMNLPPDYPAAERKLGFEWSNRSRIQRISAVLAETARASLADSMALQNDVTSSEACRLRALVAALTPADADAALGASLIRDWDCRAGVESAAAALYEVWSVRHLGDAVVAVAAPAAAKRFIGDGVLEAIVPLLEQPDARLGADPAAARTALLEASLSAAVKETRTRLGDDPSRWRWGALHRALFEPAIAARAGPELADQLRVGPLEVAGTAVTPLASRWRRSDFTAAAGASLRVVIDVGAWDNSVAVNTPGQSADPWSPHYRDLFPLWAAGAYFPLLYTRPAVEAATRQVIELTPAPRSRR